MSGNTKIEVEASGDALTLRELISFVSEAMKQDINLDQPLGANVGLSLTVPAPLKYLSIKEEN